MRHHLWCRIPVVALAEALPPIVLNRLDDLGVFGVADFSALADTVAARPLLRADWRAGISNVNGPDSGYFCFNLTLLMLCPHGRFLVG